MKEKEEKKKREGNICRVRVSKTARGGVYKKNAAHAISVAMPLYLLAYAL
jgi:hypothetical protein